MENNMVREYIFQQMGMKEKVNGIWGKELDGLGINQIKVGMTDNSQL